MSQAERPAFECDDYYEDDFGEEDPLEEALSNCSGFMDGEYFVCGAAGSEDCDWDCPFSRDIGLTAKQIEERDAATEDEEPPP